LWRPPPTLVGSTFWPTNFSPFLVGFIFFPYEDRSWLLSPVFPGRAFVCSVGGFLRPPPPVVLYGRFSFRVVRVYCRRRLPGHQMRSSQSKPRHPSFFVENLSFCIFCFFQDSEVVAPSDSDRRVQKSPFSCSYI